VKKSEVNEVVEIASRLERGDSLTSAERRQLAHLIYDQVSNLLQPKSPAHRPNKNGERDFWATMDCLLRPDTETIAIVAERWELDGAQLSTIMARGMRKEVQAQLKLQSATWWKRLVPIQRARILRK
jgi:hypothetical protein